MILKRYGTHFHSVDPNFDARAMNEIGFQRNNNFSVTNEDFERQYECVQTHELTATAEGRVQTEAEEAVLTAIREQLDQLHSASKTDEVLVIESEQGKDYPKLREKVTGFIEQGENKLSFERTIDPPLRVGLYAPRKS